MPDFIFLARRVLFGVPFGMTVRHIGKVAGRLFGQAGPSQTRLTSHPIDVLFGIDTSGVISAKKLRTNSTADLYNFGYVGSQPSIIRVALGAIPHVDRAVFID